MNFGAVDIGSNAVRLLIARILPDSDGEVIQKVAFLRVPIRLGQDVFSIGEISHTKKMHLAQTLNAYKELLDVYAVQDSRICATSAMREAKNGSEVLAFVEGRSGKKIEIIDGRAEAAFLFSTFTSHKLDRTKNYLYIDVGGGSTEFTQIVNGKPVRSKSFDIGTIRILQGIVKDEAWDDLNDWLKNIKALNPMTAIGSGGNINKIVKMMARTETKIIKRQELKDFHAFLESFTLQERIDKLGLREDRADVIVPAAHIFTYIMHKADIEEIFVPKIGLCDGIVHSLWKKNTLAQ